MLKEGSILLYMSVFQGGSGCFKEKFFLLFCSVYSYLLSLFCHLQIFLYSDVFIRSALHQEES